jgi:hypothetical protein
MLYLQVRSHLHERPSQRRFRHTSADSNADNATEKTPPPFRANHVRWPAVVELRRNTIAGLGPRGGWPWVCPDRKTKCLARSASESLLTAEDRALTGVGKCGPLRGHLYSDQRVRPRQNWSGVVPELPEVC